MFFGFGVVGTTIQSNVISGNRQAGIETARNSASISDNVITGNLIGTDATGQKAIPNGVAGVLIRNATNTAIMNNLFGVNGYAAISIGDKAVPAFANGVFIQDNWIGLTASGTSAFPNQGKVGITMLNATGVSVTGNVISGMNDNAIAAGNTTRSYFANNAFGVGYGMDIPNSGFGIAFIAGSTLNFAGSNYFGTNRLGRYYVDPSATGNYVV